jgi:hypothetical protein
MESKNELTLKWTSYYFEYKQIIRKSLDFQREDIDFIDAKYQAFFEDDCKHITNKWKFKELNFEKNIANDVLRRVIRRILATIVYEVTYLTTTQGEHQSLRFCWMICGKEINANKAYSVEMRCKHNEDTFNNLETAVVLNKELWAAL